MVATWNRARFAMAHLRQPRLIPAPVVETRKRGDGTTTPTLVARLPVSSSFRLFLLFVLGSSIAFLLAGSGREADAGQDRLQKEFYQDLRNQQPLLPGLNLVGTDVVALAQLEPEGYRMTLPAGRKVRPPLLGIGVQAAFRVAGDFRITGTYALLSADTPATDRDVAGVNLFIMRGPDGKRFARLGRFNTRQGHVYEVHDSDHSTPRKRPPANILRQPTEEKRGQLRMAREGDMLSYLIKDDTTREEFKELFRTEFGQDDLTVVMFQVNPGQEANAVDARLIDLRIEGGGGVPSSAEAALDMAGSKTSLQAGLIVGLSIVFILSASAWFYARRRRRAPQPAGLAPGSRPTTEA
jgi:hypothetical protein